MLLVNGEPVRGPWDSDGRGTAVCTHGIWRLSVRDAGDGALQLMIANEDAEPARLRTVYFARWTPDSFPTRLDAAAFRELCHGGSFRNMATGVRCVGRKTTLLEADSPSNVLIVYEREETPETPKAALLLGVVPPLGEAFSEFATLHSAPHLEGTFGFEVRHVFECLVEPGAEVSTSPVVALAGPSGVDLMDRYGALWQARLGRRAMRAPMVGWNSWDFYSGAVTRKALDENLATGQRLFGEAFRLICIDEGWESQWGDWRPNVKFPEGLADFCRHVKERGGMPGVWTAPLLVNMYNPLFLAHPDWFARDAASQVKIDSYSYGPMAYLDVTFPEVIEHVKGVFATLREAGFEYFKVDFCQCILGADRFGDGRVSRLALNRRAFTAIREAIGEDAYLLSCGAPYESVVGLVDGVRTSGDIHIYWGHVLVNAGAFSGRWWMQGRLWNGDPDFAVVRGPDTAEPPYARERVVKPLGLGGGWMCGREFNKAEARTYALLIHCTGGDVVLGDSLARLNPAGIEMLRRILTPRSAAAVPVDLFESEQDLPRIWISKGADDTLVALFNWSDKTAHTPFEPERYGLAGTPRDFWTGQPVVALPGRMPRRSSIGLLYECNAR
ncbi:MAG: alpha-galactosidase [Candidatus Hydrogenedentes bacterium]|nr:alpha-galactosidase [Candidatus Hydrogenedentota bacterium]